MSRRSHLASLAMASLLAAACAPAGHLPVTPPARFSRGMLPPPVFTDPARKAKLMAAMPALEKHFAAQRQKLDAPGLAFGVIVDGELVYERGLGVRDLETKAPVDGDTVFRIASLTKSFIAAAILKLRDEGRLSIEDPVDKYLPELAEVAYPTRDSARITVRQLLSHSAGFPEDNPWADRRPDMSEEAYARVIAKGLPFSNAPNVAYEYSNLGYVLLGMVVSRVSGVSFQRYVTAQILRPLGMTATVFDERDVPKDRLALGYRRGEGKLVNEKNTPDGVFGAMGGLFSSLHDMARYAAFHLAAWPPRDDPETGPLRRSSVREMGQAARAMRLSVWNGGLDGVPPNASAQSYGFGLVSQETCEMDRIVQHGGGLPGYGSFLYMLPEHGVAIVTLDNVENGYPALNDAARVLLASGGLSRRTTLPAPALVSAYEDVTSLLGHWDYTVAKGSFDASFFLERPAAMLRADLEKLRAAHGACKAGPLDPENALRGTWKLTCTRGWIDVRVTLAPALPTLIQRLKLEGSFAPSERLLTAAARAASLIGRWDDAAFADLFAPGVDRPSVQKQLAEAGFARGACRLGPVQRGDGTTVARFRLSCERYPIELEVKLDEASGKLEYAKLAPVDPRVVKCAQ